MLYFVVLGVELILNFLLIQYVREQAASIVKFQDRNDSTVNDDIETSKMDFSITASPVLVKLKSRFCKNEMNRKLDGALTIDVPKMSGVAPTSSNVKQSTFFIDLPEMSTLATPTNSDDEIHKTLPIDASTVPNVTSSTKSDYIRNSLVVEYPDISAAVCTTQIPVEAVEQQKQDDLNDIPTLVDDTSLSNDKGNPELPPQAIVLVPPAIGSEDTERNCDHKNFGESMKAVNSTFNLTPVINKLCGTVSSQTSSSPTMTTTGRSHNYQEKATKTVLAISFVQIVTTFPLVAAFAKNVFYLATDQIAEHIDDVYFTMNWLRVPIILNSILNAIVYVGRNQKISKLYKKMFNNVCRKLQRNY